VVCIDDTIRWLIGIVIAFAAVGLGMFYQGKVLLKPEESKKIGEQLRFAGIIWIVIAISYLVVMVTLSFTRP